MAKKPEKKERDGKEPSTYVCCQCGITTPSASHFYKTYSDMYSGNGYLPICKSCIAELYESYRKIYGSEQKALQRVCMAFDLYYNENLFLSCKSKSPEAMMGTYIKNLNMVQNRGKTFDNSLEEGFDFGKTKVSVRPEANDTGRIKQTDIAKWGYGFEYDDYKVLNEHYKYLKEANPNCDSNQEIFINDLCMTKMMQLKAAREQRTDDYNKLTDSYRKSFKEAGLKTIQDDSTVDQDCWSSFTSIVSQYTPEEYYKDKTLYYDWDKLGEYYQRHVCRPLDNIVNCTTVRDPEYRVSDEGDDNE